MTIPASRIVTVNPEVISAGGNPLVLNGLFLTQNTAMPTGTVLSFGSATAVDNFFGPASTEALQADIYFAGYVNSSIKPTAMLFAPFNLAAREAFLNGGSLASVSLSTLQSFSGTLILTVDGTLETSATINLSAATSFSNAASLIQAGFTSPPFTVTFNAITSSFVITSNVAGTASTITFATGTLAAELGLTAATGAFLSQGALADTPATAMANAIAVSQNWCSMVTLFEPLLAVKQQFLAFFTAQNNRYLYIAWDSDPNASVQGNTSSFGAIALAQQANGVVCISGDPALAAAQGVTLASLVLPVASFIAGYIASVNYSLTNGRTVAAFRVSQAGIAPTCASDQINLNLIANGYSYYGSFATANQGFIFFNNGNMPGEFLFVDNFTDQVFLNSQFQLALLDLITTVGAIAYNPQGYGLIRSALQDPINGGLNFGSIRRNVALSQAQIAEVNQAAGVNAASVIQTQGFFLQILDPGAQARANRQTPIINFWYTDGGAVQQITMASIDIL